MTIGLTYLELRVLSPCDDSLKRVAKLMGGARQWNGRTITAAQAREAGATFNDIIWAASALASIDQDVERRLRLWMTDCAARVLQHFEAERQNDRRPRDAIIASRKFARGEIGDAARAAAWAAAEAAAEAAARDAAWAAAWAAARAAAEAAAEAAARDAARDDAGAAEQTWQFDRLVARFGDVEPDDWPLPAAPVMEVAGNPRIER